MGIYGIHPNTYEGQRAWMREQAMERGRLEQAKQYWIFMRQSQSNERQIKSAGLFIENGLSNPWSR